MNPLKWHFLLLSITGHSRDVSPRRVLFFDPLSDETHNGCPVVH